jgi:propionate CoA-transferase
VCVDGLELIEIAPGINLQRDILDQMDFAPVRIADPLNAMPAHVFSTTREKNFS